LKDFSLRLLRASTEWPQFGRIELTPVRVCNGSWHVPEWRAQTDVSG
jgi:hypothetical protein